MNQYNNSASGYKKPESTSTSVSIRAIDSLAKEVIIDGVKLVVVNASYVADLEKRIRQLESQISSLRDAKSYMMQKVKSIK